MGFFFQQYSWHLLDFPLIISRWHTISLVLCEISNTFIALNWINHQLRCGLSLIGQFLFKSIHTISLLKENYRRYSLTVNKRERLKQVTRTKRSLWLIDGDFKTIAQKNPIYLIRAAFLLLPSKYFESVCK